MGSQYVNDFDFNNRAYRVYVQADQQFRSRPEDIGRYYAQNEHAATCCRSATSSASRETTAPQVISHYNLFRSVEISGSAAPGYSSGEAIRIMEDLSRRTLPQGFGFEWSGLSLEEIQAGSQAAAIFGLGLLLVYLTLAGQYESLTLPFIILLSVPLAILGALAAQWTRGLANDVYCQVGPGHAHRPLGQERHPDRRVRRAAAGARHEHHRSRGRSRAHPPAPHSHDVARLHPRRPSARLRDGRRT